MIPVILIVTGGEIRFLKAMNGMEVRLNRYYNQGQEQSSAVGGRETCVLAGVWRGLKWRQFKVQHHLWSGFAWSYCRGWMRTPQSCTRGCTRKQTQKMQPSKQNNQETNQHIHWTIRDILTFGIEKLSQDPPFNSLSPHEPFLHRGCQILFWAPYPLLFAFHMKDQWFQCFQATPLARLGEPEDTAAAVAFLCLLDQELRVMQTFKWMALLRMTWDKVRMTSVSENRFCMIELSTKFDYRIHNCKLWP